MVKKSNKGFDYEEKINQILIKKKLIPKDSQITGGADKADVSLVYNNNKILIELKNKLIKYLWRSNPLITELAFLFLLLMCLDLYK